MPSMRVGGMNRPVRFRFPGRKDLLEVNRRYGIKTCVGKVEDEFHYANKRKSPKGSRYSYLGDAIYSIKESSVADRIFDDLNRVTKKFSDRSELDRSKRSYKELAKIKILSVRNFLRKII